MLEGGDFMVSGSRLRFAQPTTALAPWFRVYFTIGAIISTYTIVGVPCYDYRIMGPKTLF